MHGPGGLVILQNLGEVWRMTGMQGGKFELGSPFELQPVYFACIPTKMAFNCLL